MSKYISLIFLFGLVYIFVIPPFQVPDTRNHLARASQIADGQFIAEKRENHTGGMIPKSIHSVARHFSYMSFDPNEKTSMDYIISAFSVRLNAADNAYHGFENTALFSPLPYLPAAFAIWLTSTNFDSVLISLYAAEVATLLTSVLIIGLAMTYLPAYQPLIFAFSMLPMFLFQLASISADSISNSMAMLFICQIFSIIYYQKQVNITVFLPILITAVALALCKQTYSLLLVCALLISPHYFSSLRNYFVYALMFTIVMSMTVIVWNSIAKDIYTPWNANIGTDAQAQLMWVSEHLILFQKVILNDLYKHASDYVLMMGGTKLGWVDTDIPVPVIGLHLALLCILALVIFPKINLNVWQHALCGFIIVTGIFLVELSIYLHTERVGSIQLRSVHGRYFLYLFFFFLIQLASINIKLAVKDKIIYLLTVLSTASFLVSVPVIIQRYYVS